MMLVSQNFLVLYSRNFFVLYCLPLALSSCSTFALQRDSTFFLPVEFVALHFATAACDVKMFMIFATFSWPRKKVGQGGVGRKLGRVVDRWRVAGVGGQRD